MKRSVNAESGSAAPRPAINGETLVYGIIGDPVAHSFSPVIHNSLAAMLGHNLAYVPFPVWAGNLGDAVKGAYALGVAGLNVTVPHKQAVMPFLAGLDASAEQVGAVNTLRRCEEGYIGFNTDRDGLSRALAAAGVRLEGRCVVVIGAGGAAYAAAAAAARGGAGKIFCVNRSADRALALVRQAKTYYNGDMEALTYEELGAVTAELTDGFVCLQASSVGFGALAGVSPVADGAFFQKAGAVLDMIYSPWETRFLRLARENGCTVRRNGFDMLAYQALAAYEIWHGAALEPAFCEKAVQGLRRYYMEAACD